MRNRLITLGAIITILVAPNTHMVLAGAQQQSTPQEAKAPFLAEDTPVRLRLMQTLSSGTSKVNDKVDFEVVEDVKVGNTVVIPQGGTAIATVTEAKGKKSFGRSGKLNVNIDYVRLANGDKVPLRAVKGGSGGSRTGVMTGAVVATAIVFFPAAPLFFFIKGKNITIPKGTEITGYIAADTVINTATIAPKAESNTNIAVGSSESLGTLVSTIVVTSNPNGAEITVDGKFMGTTESTLKLSPGEHTVKIGKAGYKEWNRTITLGAGSSITIDATLEKNQ
jgi:hypothetical protein